MLEFAKNSVIITLMFRVLLFFIFASSSFGLSITLNNGKTGGNDYYILHIENEREFSCQVKIGNNYYPPDYQTTLRQNNKTKKRNVHRTTHYVVTLVISEGSLAYGRQ